MTKYFFGGCALGSVFLVGVDACGACSWLGPAEEDERATAGVDITEEGEAGVAEADGEADASEVADEAEAGAAELAEDEERATVGVELAEEDDGEAGAAVGAGERAAAGGAASGTQMPYRDDFSSAENS